MTVSLTAILLGGGATCGEEELLFDNSSLERRLQRQRLRRLNGYVSVVLTLLACIGN